MPLYDYKCPGGHITEKIRKYLDRDQPVLCHCGEMTARMAPLPHCPPDGIYSYAPNIGSANAFEKRQQAIKDGVKVMPKIQD